MNHPYGVLPEGQALLLNTSVASSRRGLGEIGRVDDARVLEVLAFLDGRSLAACCVASGALRCFAAFEDLWKNVALRAAGLTDAPLRYAGGSWKNSVTGGRRAEGVSRPVLSDVLYHPHRLAVSGCVELGAGAGAALGNCARVAAAELGVEAFIRDFEAPAKPLVIEGGAAAAAADSVWDATELKKRFGDRAFHVGGYAFGLGNFLDYAADNVDDQPLYLFDKRFAEVAPELAAAYEPPAYFDDDLFGLLDGPRPDWRWLIVGGARSGSAWHVDPNRTSAWNATLRGRKRWLFFPPKVTPPGVRPSADGLDLLAPLSLAEWAAAFYGEAREHPQFVDALTGPGDVVFVPRGWWHCVVNLDDFTVAVTHNFCSPRGLASTLGLLRDAPHLVSGLVRDERVDECDDRDEVARRAALGSALHDRLVTALRRKRPDALAAAEAELAAPKSLWARVTGERAEAAP
eukprot:CAMPEP_0119262142 /NCGR_PEP_ID=MMETSP1329-20130426/1959_1 /TAXON_ID=114041 /ORGANISM="Genus nov. species nov., Strain RCC1024" /LENGTH=459 /DNA_ID=CAMNT_0007261755 /DNA_START=91 /DNA_END=1467 /DNA_ORIENTATION=-